jgi:hypothetical protein
MVNYVNFETKARLSCEARCSDTSRNDEAEQGGDEVDRLPAHRNTLTRWRRRGCTQQEQKLSRLD